MTSGPVPFGKRGSLRWPSVQQNVDDTPPLSEARPLSDLESGDVAPATGREEGPRSWISTIFFQWVSPLVMELSTATERVRFDQLWKLRPDDSASQLYTQFMEDYNTHRSIGWAFFNICRFEFNYGAACMMIHVLGQLTTPFIMQICVAKIQRKEYDSIYWLIGFSFCNWISNIFKQHYLDVMFQAGIRLRALSTVLIYRQSIKLRECSRHSISNGDIANLLANDTQKFYDLLPKIQHCWGSPLLIIVISYYLWVLIGWTSIVGVGTLVAIVPLNKMLVQWTQTLRQEHLPITDERVRLCSETVLGIRVVKYFGWVDAFIAKIMDVRAREVAYLYKELTVWTITISIIIVFPVIAGVCTWTVYAKFIGPLNAPDTYAVMLCFVIIRFPLMETGDMLVMAVQTYVALGRISDLLELTNQISPEDSAVPERGITLSQGEFAWHSDSKEASFCLGRGAALELRIEPGELVAVIGAVGTGKSMLLESVLRETYRRHGRLSNPTSVAYASQHPFILNNTVRANILFGKPFDEAWYRTVVDACCLNSDFADFNESDLTEVGDRGITLSGGQKARVGLARAIYEDADVVLLDDPLSALDAHTGRKVFDALFGADDALARGKCTLLVTHAIQYLSMVDRIVFLAEGGSVVYDGRFEDLKDSQQDGTRGDLLKEILSTIQEETDEGKDAERRVEERTALGTKVGKFMTEETREGGTLSFDVYKQYVQSQGGWRWLAFYVCCLFVERATYATADWWLATWTDAEKGPPGITLLGLEFPGGHTADGIDFYIIGYWSVALVNAALATWRLYFYTRLGMWAATSLFEGVLQKILRSPVPFFDATPIGRIINRLTFDTEMIDYVLITIGSPVYASSGWICTSLVIMASITPLSLVVVFPSMLVFLYVYTIYRGANSQLQRLDAVCRSPIQSHSSECLAGAKTIRAFQRVEHFQEKFDRIIDQSTQVLLSVNATRRWLVIHMDMLGLLCVLAVSVACWHTRDTIAAGMAGMVLIWSTNLVLSFNFCMFFCTEFEAKLTSVERVKQYISDLQTEPSTGELVPPKSWPHEGRITFDNAVLRYRAELEPALKGLSVDISPGERVAVVGRTGAGKSTIAVALFRIIELLDGRISIDGLDLRRMSLQDIRGRGIVIIPQDPVLFSGSLRDNVDPFKEFTDDKIWEALRWASLDALVRGMEGELSTEVEEFGNNFSVGQQQLLCLARALLRNPAIVVMDEATANVDVATDRQIHQAVKLALKNTTILQIAHRLQSVMDADKVLVMHKGVMAEFDTPVKLLENPDGMFTKLVEATGKASANQLKTLSRSLSEAKEQELGDAIDLEQGAAENVKDKPTKL